jgi:hypothetical protein
MPALPPVIGGRERHGAATAAGVSMFDDGNKTS